MELGLDQKFIIVLFSLIIQQQNSNNKSHIIEMCASDYRV